MQFSIFNFQFPILKRGFTLIEILVILGVLVILVVLAAPIFQSFRKESSLTNSSQEIVNNLRLAQNKTLASEGASQWGIYFSTTTLPQEYTLFKGSSYGAREPSFDKTRKIPKTIEIYEVNLAGSAEVVFSRVSGQANPSGSLSLRLIDDPSRTRTVSVEPSGKITLGTEPSPSDLDRQKDSRHLHFDYSGRNIATSTENLILTFSDPPNPDTVETIIIADNFKDDQIDWSGEVVVGGETQKLKIHTHRLNDPVLGSQFSLHRDRRYNSKALKLEISGDATGDLIQYAADGQTTAGTSIYASGPVWQ